MVAIVAVAMLAFGSTSFLKAESQSDLGIGKPAPDFSLQDQAGNTVKLSDLKGKIVVLEWFNEQCPFVVKFYKDGHMNKWSEKYQGQGVVWLAVNSSNFATNDTNKAIHEKWNIKHAILNDASGEVGKKYQSKNTPTIYMIDKEGNLAYWGGVDNKPTSETSDIDSAENYVAKGLDELLAGKPLSTPRTKPYGCTVKYAK
jgi:peroxiredoxin